MDSQCVIAIAACIAALANIVIAAGVFLARKQLKLSREIVNADHKRSALMLSLEVCREWNRSQVREVVDAKRFITSLDVQTCMNIARSSFLPPKEIRISQKDTLHFIESCLAGAPSDTPFLRREDRTGQSIVTAAGVQQLRYLGVHYLNELEVALSAWQKGVGDQDYLERQFEFLDKGGSEAMHTFRKAVQAAGGTTPAIDAFLKRKEKGPDPESKIGQDS